MSVWPVVAVVHVINHVYTAGLHHPQHFIQQKVLSWPSVRKYQIIFIVIAHVGRFGGA